VRSVFELASGFKLSHELTQLPETNSLTPKSYSIDVSMFTGSEPESFAQSVLAAFHGVSVAWTKKSDPPAVRFVVPAANLVSVIGALATHGDVEFVEMGHELRRDNDNSVWISQSYDTFSGPDEAAASDPKTSPNVTVQTVVPSDTTHPIIPNPNHRKIWAINAHGGVYPLPTGPVPPSNCVRHGTHTSGSIAGDCRINLPSLVVTPSCPQPPCYGHDTGDGMAPLGKLLLELGQPLNGGAVSDLLAQQWVAGARLSSFSWSMTSTDIDMPCSIPISPSSPRQVTPHGSAGSRATITTPP
jgi:hypothetical protein